jgi:heme/copper-type cytochrome/quinol oxidase subunit 2
MWRNWAIAYFCLCCFLQLCRLIFFIVVLAFSADIGRFTGLLVTAILISMVVEGVMMYFIWRYQKALQNLSEEDKVKLKPLITCCC